MILSPSQLARLDARIDRCVSCGGWRWDRQCRVCEVVRVDDDPRVDEGTLGWRLSA